MVNNISSSKNENNKALFSRFSRGIKYVAIQNWGHSGVNLIVFVVLARLLAPESIGLVAMSMVYIALVQVFLEQGFVEAVIQSQSTSSSFLDTAFWTNFSFALVLGGSSVLASPFIGALFSEPRLPPVVCGLAPLLIIRGTVSVHIALLRREMAFRRLAVAAVSGVVVGGIVGISMAMTGFGVWSLVAYQIITRLVEATILWIKNSWRPGKQITYNDFRRLFGFGASVTGSRLVNFLNRYGADLIIGFFLGPVAVGYYNISFRITRSLVEMLGSVVSMVSFPLFSKLKEDPDTGRQAFSRILEQIAFLAFPVFMGTVACAPQMVEVFFGQKWMSAVPLMRILAAIGLLEAIYYMNTALFLGYGKPQWRFGLDVLNAVTNSIVFFVAAQWSVVAVAIGYVIRGYVFSPIPLFGVKKLLNISLLSYIKNISIQLIAGGIMCGGLLAASQVFMNLLSAVQLLFAQFVVGAVIYLSIIFLISPEIPLRTFRFAGTALGKIVRETK